MGSVFKFLSRWFFAQTCSDDGGVMLRGVSQKLWDNRYPQWNELPLIRRRVLTFLIRRPSLGPIQWTDSVLFRPVRFLLDVAPKATDGSENRPGPAV